jgi:hypothetical protein
MPSPSRYYSSNAAKTTLADSISSSATSLTLSAASNLPAQYPYTLILEKDTANEEVVEVTSLVGSSYQITRNIDSSGAKAHAVGANVEHGVSARDFTESRAHEIATTAHGVTGDVVGTGGSQTLTSKTLTTPTINGATISGTFTSTATISGGTITGASITGLATPTTSSSAATKGYIDTSVTSAAASATAAATSAASASTSASSAATSASSALTSATSAATSATAAATSAASASTSASSAQTFASTMATSVSSAATSASSAATSAASALTSQTSAATSASSAATSATSAANSATTAAASVATIASLATAAATSEANALTSANSAATSASSAATSASSAATSASTMATSVSSAQTSASSAATSAASAATSASSAATSASSAAASDVSAQNWATQLSTPVAGGEYSAKYHAQAAATSASSASTSASSAATSASSAAASYDAFDDRYLGSKASDPNLDNDGNALLTGALYFNTAISALKVYSGTAWGLVAPDTTNFIDKAILTAKGSLISASAGSTPVALTAAATNGYLLSISSATTSGLAWTAPPVDIFSLNLQTLTSDYTIDAGYNAHSVGPVTIDTGVTITIPSGATWLIN